MTSPTTTRTARRLATIAVAAGLGVTGLGAVPAGADAPVDSDLSYTFEGVNPCTGGTHEVTIDLQISDHLHDGRLVSRAQRSGTTSDGYVMEHGGDHIVINGQVVALSLNDVWRHPDGSAFAVRNTTLIGPDGVVVDAYRPQCIRP